MPGDTPTTSSTGFDPHPAAFCRRYDEVGNRLSKLEGGANATYSYGSCNKLTGDGFWSYSYDGNGNIVWKGWTGEKWEYRYNSFDQPTEVVDWFWNSKRQRWNPTVAGTYAYDGNGARAKTIENGVETHYLYLGHDPLCEKTGSTYTDYVYVNGRTKARLVGADSFYYISDALGSTCQVWKDGDAAPVFSVTTYKPFGTPVSGSDKVRYALVKRARGAHSTPL